MSEESKNSKILKRLKREVFVEAFAKEAAKWAGFIAVTPLLAFIAGVTVKVIVYVFTFAYGLF